MAIGTVDIDGYNNQRGIVHLKCAFEVNGDHCQYCAHDTFMLLTQRRQE